MPQTEIAQGFEGALYSAAKLFACELDQDTLLHRIADEARSLCGADYGALFFHGNDDAGHASLRYALSGAPPEAFGGFSAPRATPLFAATFGGETVRLDDVRQDPRFGAWGEQPGKHPPVVSYLAVPFLTPAGEALGGLFMAHREAGRFTDKHQRILVGLSMHGAAALENARLYEALKASQANALESARRKDDFLALLSHELRNPLSPILTALQLMKLRKNNDCEKERLVIERQVNHMVGLVDDLLDVSRITRGKIDLKKQRVELVDCIRQGIEMASPLIEMRHHRLEVAVPDHGLRVHVDPNRIAQVVANLLTNAARYTPSGGVISVRADREGEEVSLRVRDNGKGISEPLLSDVFGLFVQDERNIDRSEGGLGLGLPIVRSLVELHSGKVSARSDGVDRGSEFEVRLPRIPDTHVQAETSPPSDADHGTQAVTRLPILVVDDNVDAADILTTTLCELGYAARTAYDGPSALELVQSFKPALAILDIGLPVMDGYDLARRLTGQPTLDHIALVALTGYGQPQDVQQAHDAGFDAHLVKPVDLGVLLNTIERLVHA